MFSNTIRQQRLVSEKTMTNEEIAEYRRKEKAFLETPVGRAFHRFKSAHSRYWRADGSDRITDRRLRELDEAARNAERELRDLIEPTAVTSG